MPSVLTCPAIQYAVKIRQCGCSVLAMDLMLCNHILRQKRFLYTPLSPPHACKRCLISHYCDASSAVTACSSLVSSSFSLSRGFRGSDLQVTKVHNVSPGHKDFTHIRKDTFGKEHTL